MSACCRKVPGLDSGRTLTVSTKSGRTQVLKNVAFGDGDHTHTRAPQSAMSLGVSSSARFSKSQWTHIAHAPGVLFSRALQRAEQHGLQCKPGVQRERRDR